MASGTLTDSLAETLRLFGGSGEPRTTTEIAEELDLGRRSTYDRLERLVAQDRLETKKVGANARVWWRPRSSSDGAAAAATDWPRAAESLIDDVFADVAVGVFVLDADFEVAWINETTERYFGLDRADVLGRDKRELVTERIAPSVADSEGFAETVLATYDDNTYTERFECHLRAGDKREERWLEHRSKPIETGEYAGGRVELYYDITARKETERQRRENRKELESLVAAVDEYAIVTLDPEGRVRTWNPGARRITGYDEDEILGEHFSTFYTAADRDDDVPERTLAAAARDGSVEEEGWCVRADGTEFWASVTVTPIRGDDGELRGFATVTRDMTERRQREEQLRSERRLTDEVLETAPVRLAVYDADGEIERVNSLAREELGLEAGDSDCFEGLEVLDDGDLRPMTDDPVDEVIETGEPIADLVVAQETPDGDRRWTTLTASPLFDADGDLERVVVAGNDITELKRKEQQLKRQRDDLAAELDDVFARVDDAVYALDEDWQFTYLNQRAEELLDTPAEELLGVSVWDAFPNAREGAYREQFERAMATQEPVVFEAYSNTADAHLEVTAYPSENGLSVYFRDVSERKERERELERYETIVDSLWDGVYALDPEENFAMVNDAFLEMTGYEREELLGEPGKTVHNEAVNRAAEDEAESVVRGEQEGAVLEFDLETKDGETIPVESRFGPYQYDDERYGRCGVIRDVTARKEYERYLEEAKAQLEAATEAGAVGTFEWHVQDDEMVAGPAFAKTFGVDPAAAREGVPLDRFLDRIHDEDRDRVERAIEQAVATCGDYEEEYRVEDATGEYRWVVARGTVECDAEGQPRTFPGALTDITARKEAELELERQRRRLAALNNLNQVVREITDAIIEQSSREEIEATVCERLAATDSYSFAWIGEVDGTTGEVHPRTEHGVEGYLDGITITVDPDDARSEGPTGRALRTGEVQVTNDVEADRRHDPWRDHVADYDFRSSAAIPIAHEGTVYGVLNVYADRPRAFAGEERDVIAQLGEIVGHAIAATERKRALMSDELVELGFAIEDVFGALDVDADPSGRLSLDHTVALGDGEYLVYGTATEDAVPAAEALGQAVPHWESVTVDAEETPATVEIRMRDPPVLSAVASLGGYVDEAVVEDGDYRMALHLAPSVDVRRVIEAVEDAYPAAEMVRRRQISRADADHERRPQELVADLTDRQRTALEAAFHAGFFEWPRDASGEEVAEAIGVASPTFHQHLRKAERKVFASVLTHDAHRPDDAA